MYDVLNTPAYDRAYKKLPAEIQRRTDEQVLRLRIDPFHPSLRTHKRRDDPNVWQARVTLNYRLLFRLEGNAIVLLTVMSHEK